MKRAIILVAATATAFGLVGIAGAATVGNPEVDQARASFHVTTDVTPASVTCAGEADDPGVTYETDISTLKGTETDTGSVANIDVKLAGKLALKASITTQIVGGTNSGAGFATGTATLKGSGGATKYKGSFTALTQVTNPDPTNTVVEGRGLLDAKMYDPATGQPNGDHLLANFEFKLTSVVSGTTTTTTIDGEFGIGPQDFASLNYAVETNEQTCA